MRKFSTFSHLFFRESLLGQLFWAPIFHSPTLELENCFLRRKFRLQPARAAISQNPDGGVRPTTWLLFSAAAAVWSMPRCQRLCCMSDAITIMTDKGNIHDSRKRGWGGFRRPKFEVLLQPLISTSMRFRSSMNLMFFRPLAGGSFGRLLSQSLATSSGSRQAPPSGCPKWRHHPLTFFRLMNLWRF